MDMPRKYIPAEVWQMTQQTKPMVAFTSTRILLFEYRHLVDLSLIHRTWQQRPKQIPPLWFLKPNMCEVWSRKDGPWSTQGDLQKDKSTYTDRKQWWLTRNGTLSLTQLEWTSEVKLLLYTLSSLKVSNSSRCQSFNMVGRGLHSSLPSMACSQQPSNSEPLVLWKLLILFHSPDFQIIEWEAHKPWLNLGFVRRSPRRSSWKCH